MQDGAVELALDWIYVLCVYCCLVFSHPAVHQKATACARFGCFYLRCEAKKNYKYVSFFVNFGITGFLVMLAPYPPSLVLNRLHFLSSTSLVYC